MKFKDGGEGWEDTERFAHFLGIVGALLEVYFTRLSHSLDLTAVPVGI